MIESKSIARFKSADSKSVVVEPLQRNNLDVIKWAVYGGDWSTLEETRQWMNENDLKHAIAVELTLPKPLAGQKKATAAVPDVPHVLVLVDRETGDIEVTGPFGSRDYAVRWCQEVWSDRPNPPDWEHHLYPLLDVVLHPLEKLRSSPALQGLKIVDDVSPRDANRGRDWPHANRRSDADADVVKRPCTSFVFG